MIHLFSSWVMNYGSCRCQLKPNPSFMAARLEGCSVLIATIIRMFPSDVKIRPTCTWKPESWSLVSVFLNIVT